MNSLTSATRRGGIVTAAVLTTMALAGCSAGQITQTADQAAAVDGASVWNQDPRFSVNDITILLNDQTGEAALKFTATNEDVESDASGVGHELLSVSVDGQDVDVSEADPIRYNCSLVADAEAHFDEHYRDESAVEATNACIQRISTEMDNNNYAFGGTVPVIFEFSFGTIEADAAVAAQTFPAGDAHRDYSSEEGYTSN